MERKPVIQNQIDSSERVKSHFYAVDGCYIRLSPTAWKILSEREEGKSFEKIAHDLSHQNQETVSPENVETAWKYIQEKVESIRKNSNPVRSGFWLRLPLIPQSLVSKLAEKFQPAFNPVCAAFLILLIIVGSGFFYLSDHSTAKTHWLPDIILGYVLYIFSIFIHELGHSSACQRFGAKPSAIGFTLYMIYPAFYSDVNDAWRLQRWQRVIVDLSGLYFHFVVGAVFSILWYYTGWQPFRVAIFGILASSLINLNPILRFDGYWVVCDLLGVYNLGNQPIKLLKNGIMRLRGKQPPPLPWTYKVSLFLIFYSIAWFAFFMWFLKLVLPFLIGKIETYPQLISDSIDRLSNGSVNQNASPYIPLLVSTFIFIIALRILWVIGIRSTFRFLVSRFSNFIGRR